MGNFFVRNTPLSGVHVIDCPHFLDKRGDFTKLFHAEVLHENGIDFKPAESFLTRSNAGVLRGMHFQIGEAAHDKLVTCIKGRVLDVVVDIRRDSPNFNQHFAIELDRTDGKALLIGKGYAHGFFTLDDDSWMLYYTSTVHSPDLDRGVLWNSIAFSWPTSDPILSERDCSHPSIHDLR